MRKTGISLERKAKVRRRPKDEWSGGLNFRPEIGAAGSILSKYDEVVALVEAARGVILSRGRPRGTARS